MVGKNRSKTASPIPTALGSRSACRDAIKAPVGSWARQMAKDSGFTYYAKVPWKKGDFVANTGRKSKNTEDVMIFSKGEPRSLKLDAKKNLAIAKENNIDTNGKSSYEIRDELQKQGLSVYYMKGTNGMLPTVFDVQPRSKKEKVMEAEKPVRLLEEIIQYITQPYEVVLDQFAGSGNIAIACLNTERDCIAIEKDVSMFEKMKNNIMQQTNTTITELQENIDEPNIEDDFEI